VTVVVAVLCLVWLAVSLPLGVLLGHAFRTADAVDPGELALPTATGPVGARAHLSLPVG
jgi:hypothetical protein